MGNKLPLSRQVLLLVDVINPFDFSGADSMLPAAAEAARRIDALRQRWHARHWAVIYANDHAGGWHCDFSTLVDRCRALPGQRGEIARRLAPAPQDLVVLKPQYSAFHSTPLPHLLREMRTDRLVITGFATDICVMLTATDACMSGYRVWVPRDCTAAESTRRERWVLRHLRETFGCAVRPAWPVQGAPRFSSNMGRSGHVLV